MLAKAMMMKNIELNTGKENGKKMKVWMAVTRDEYELPIAIADTAEGLAKLVGTTTNAVVSTVSHYRKGRKKKCKYYQVEIDEDE